MPTPASLSTDKTVGVLLAPGCEEVEALAVVDALFRAGIHADLIAVFEDLRVVSSHGVSITCDLLLAQADLASYELLFLPGGMPGTMNLAANEQVCREIDRRAKAGLDLAAICAAPSILASRGHLKGRRATANPGFMEAIAEGGAHALEERVVVDGPFLTSRGAGTAFELGFAIVERFLGEKAAGAVREALVY